MKKSFVSNREIALYALFVAAIAAGARFYIPVGGSEFTLQFLFANLAGLLLGKKGGAITLGIYLALGLIGVPVFAVGGGIAYVLRPSFGYLLGFLAGAYAAGYVLERQKSPTFKALLIAGLVNFLIVYVLGMTYNFLMTNLYVGDSLSVWTLVLYDFILQAPGDILLCFAGAWIAKQLLPIIKREAVGGGSMGASALTETKSRVADKEASFNSVNHEEPDSKPDTISDGMEEEKR
ncbi:MAG: biotin transporter BioY [Clostridiales bacterium]|jgi:biotin transport system substrate-specific component|nr:biotin transporter BioY [Clostridiales bacterium]